MAIQATETEGTNVYIAPAGTAVSGVTEIQAAIAAGDAIGCIQDLGEVGFTRPTRSIKCISTGEVSERLGSKVYDPFTIALLFNALDTLGQEALREASENETQNVFILELSDEPATGASPHPTYITFDGEVKDEKIVFTTDEDVLINMTISMLTKRVITDAAETPAT